MHGHDFLLIASGNGTFDESVIANADLTNPPRRDVATLPAPGFGGPVGGYLVLAILLDNPGVWVCPLYTISDSATTLSHRMASS